MKTLTIRKPDDWHAHFRDGDKLTRTVNDTAKHFQRAIAMPNLTPPVTLAQHALDYKKRLLAALKPDLNFEPLMTLYLTDNTTAACLKEAKQAGVIACKLYPAGATTHSDAGITALKPLYPVFETMAALGLILQIHGEVTTQTSDIFDRERLFIEQHLSEIVERFPTLKIILEHVSTRSGIDFINNAPANVAGTLTPQHLLYNRNDLLSGGIKPHFYCLPILKRHHDQIALIEAATSGNPKFFLGTDTAPHAQSSKESPCGCAGIYSSPYAMAIYAQIFEQEKALDKLEAFSSLNGANFYGLPYNQHTITLIKKPQVIPESLSFGEQQVIPIGAGTKLEWQVCET